MNDLTEVFKDEPLNIFHLAFGQLRESINANTDKMKFIMMNAKPKCKWNAEDY